MRKVYFLVLTILWATISNGQSSANYTFSTNATASLTDMSTGTTQLVAPGSDDVASAVTNIGFEFWFMGVRYSQFSVNSNGYLRLGATAVATTQYTLGTASVPLIASMGSDLMISTVGKIHYKVVGSAPNRVLVVEFKDATIIYDGAGATADGTSQIRLYETSNNIELVYGSMARNSSTGFLGGMDPQYIGFSTNSTSNTYATITNATNAVATTGAVTSNQNTQSAAMPNLNSASDGSRRIYTFAPQAPNAPTGLNFTAVSAVSMTLNWTDNSTGETGFEIYRSTDGVNYTSVGMTAANAVSSVQSGLSPTTTYFWRVYAIRETASSALSGSQATSAPGNIVSAGSGNWSSTVPNAPWPGGIIPTAGDHVTIADGNTVTIDVAAVAYSLTVGQGTSGVLQYEQATARTLTVGGDVTIANGGTFQSNAAGTVTTHSLSLAGNLTNNGTLDFSTNGNTAGAGVTFTGATSNTFSGTGATTDIRTLTINKGTSNVNILELMPSSFTVQGATTDGTAMAFLTLMNGTLKVSGTFTLTGRLFPTPAGYTIAATTGLWLNNPNFTVAGQNGSPTLAGLLRITQGTLNIGTSTGNSMGFSGGSTVIIEGGAVNAAGRFGVAAAGNVITYNQSGGTVTVCTVGNAAGTGSFDLGTSTSSNIAISGGTIAIQLASTNATPIDYRNQAGTGITAVTGGTLQLGNAASGAAKVYSIRGVVPNLLLTNTSAGHSASWSTTLANFNNISRNITISSGTTLNLGNVTFLFAGTTITNNGTLTHNGASSRFIAFEPTNMTYTGTGSVTAPMTSFELQNDLNFTFDPSVSTIVTNRVIIFTGSFVNSNKLSVGNGGSTTAVIQIGNTTTPTNAGGFDSQVSYNPGSGGISISYLRTVNTRTTGFEIPSNRTISRMTYDDNDPSHTLAIAGGDLLLSGTGTALTLTNGRVVTGANTLIVNDATATVTRTAGYVDGNLLKNYAAAASKTFEVGTANGYSPVGINVTAGTFPTGIIAKAVQATQPSLNPATSLARYWSLSGAGVTADLTFNYLAGDVNGTEANYKVVRVAGATVTPFPTSTVNTTTHVGTYLGATSFSDWSLSEACAGAVGGTATGSTSACTSATPTITASGYSEGVGSGYQWQSSNDNFVSNIVDIIGQTNPAALTVGTVTTTTYYRLQVTCPAGTAVAYSNVITVTVIPQPAAFTVGGGGAYCSNQAAPSVTLSGSESGVNYQLYLGASPVGSPVAGTGSSLNFGPQATAGTYTVVGADGTATCTTNMTGSVTITANAAPVLSGTVTEPTSCVSTDGAINLTVSGSAPGPYTYNWSTPNGSGLVNGQEDQASLTVGTYTVVVTAQSGCSETTTFTLLGPGGCSVCPTIGTVTTNAGAGICEGASVTVTASGLTGMSNVYGITFKYSTSTLADPYTGGTVLGTVANGSLTGGGTTATFTGTIPTPGSYYIYAILTPTPLDPSCRPASQTNLFIAPTTSVNPVTNLVVCNNANTPVIPFTSSVAGTTYSWTNNNTSIGLGANGTGNIASFLATNTGTAPVTATVTVTPSLATPSTTSVSFPYTGGMQTWTVPAGVTSITIDAYGAGGGTGASGNSIDGATLGGPGGRGSRASGTLAVTPGQVLNIFVGGAGAVSAGGYNGGGTGGNSTSGGGGGASDIRYPGTASGDRLIVAGGGGGGGRGGCESANTINGGAGGNGDTNGANGTDAPTSGGVAGAGGGGISTGAGGAAGVGCGGFLGQPGQVGTAAGVGGNGGAGQACCCFTYGSVPGGGGGGGGYLGGGGGGGGSAGTPGCSGNDKGAGGGGAGGTSYTGGVTAGNTTSGVQTGDGLVVITYNLGDIICTGTPQTFTITVNPTPTVNAVTSQTVCNGSSVTAVNFSGAVTGTVYNWTNNTPSIGLAASGTGNIASFNATNTGNAPVTATITVTPSYTNAGTTCTGTPTTFTITVNPTPTVNAVSNQTVCNGANTAAINFSGAVAGTVYNWTNNTTSIGLAASGTGNIAAFPATNTGTTPVVATITVTPSYTNAGTTCTGTPVSFTITVNPSAAISVQPANTAACVGQSATFSVTATGVSLTYQWQVNSGSGFTNLSNASPYSGVTTPTLTINPAAAGLNNNTYRVVVSSACGSATSNAATLTVNPLPTVSVGPSGQCSPVTLTATGNSNTYSWSPALGLNTTTGATVIATTNATITYTVTGTITATGCTNTATATVLGTPPPVVVSPANPSICAGTIQQLTVPGGAAILNSAGTITIPFGAPGTTSGPANPYPSSITAVGLPTSGVTVKSVTINGITHPFPDDLDILLQSPTGQNVVLMSDVGGSNALSNVSYTFDDAASSLMSDAGANAAGTYRPTNFVTPDTWAAPGPGAINQPTPTLSSFTGNPNGNWGLYIVDDATGNVGSIANWSITFNVPTATWTPATGLFIDPAGTIPYTAGTLVNTVYANPANTTTYTVTGTMGSCSVPSGTVTVTVNPRPTISVTPNNQCGPVTLTASGTGNTYSWSPAAGLSATTGATVTANPQFNTTYTVTSTITATGCTNTATVTVNATPAAPTVTPSAITICRGATTTLTAASQPIVVNSTCGTITVPAGAPTTTNGVASPYPCSINVSGFPTVGNVVVKSVTLNGVTHAFPDDLDIVLQSPNGQNVILMSDVGGNNSITNVNYVFDDAAAAMSDAGANPAGTYRPTNIGTGDAWAAPGPGAFNQTTPRLSDFAGNFNGDWKLFVVDDAANNVGSITSWSITFQRLDGAIWTPVTGLFTNPAATVPYVAGTYASTVYAAPTTTTTYSATVGSPSSSCVSAATTAVVTVLQPVTITTQPANQTVCVGANATFSVVAAGSLPSYQWQLSTDNGGTWANIANANGASLVVANTTAAMNGYRYRVLINNTCTNVTSNAAILTVNTLTTVTVGQLPASICLSDAPITLTGSPVGGSWSGIGVSGNTFVPAATAVGTYTLTYTYANTSGCSGTATVVARVVDCQDRNILLRDGAVQLYPNPNNGQFNLRIVSTLYNRLGMAVYNSKGQVVRTQEFSGLVYGRVLPVDLTDLPSAVYMVKLYYDDGVRTSEKTFKVIVAK